MFISLLSSLREKGNKTHLKELINMTILGVSILLGVFCMLTKTLSRPWTEQDIKSAIEQYRSWNNMR